MSKEAEPFPLLDNVGLPIPFVRIRSVYGALPRSERKVADYVLDHADEVACGNATRRVRLCGVFYCIIM